MGNRRGTAGKIPGEQSAIVGVNIRTLRQRKGWTQAKLGELMGWPNASAVCAAEGHRDGRQRGFTTEEIRQLAALFGICPSQLTTRCVNCGGHPPAGFACLACAATPGRSRLPGVSRSSGGVQMSTRVKGATVLVTVTAHATLSARFRALLAVRTRGTGAGDLALQPQRRQGRPRGNRARRRDDGPHGRAQVRSRYQRGRIPAGNGRKRLV